MVHQTDLMERPSKKLQEVSYKPQPPESLYRSAVHRDIVRRRRRLHVESHWSRKGDEGITWMVAEGCFMPKEELRPSISDRYSLYPVTKLRFSTGSPIHYKVIFELTLIVIVVLWLLHPGTILRFSHHYRLWSLSFMIVIVIVAVWPGT